jgi:acetylornithine deacetylase
LPGETESSVRVELEGLFRRHKLRAMIRDEKSCACHPMETGTELPLVRKFLQAAGQKGPTGADFFCDASVLAHAGLPSIVFGPGDIAQAHTAKEWISQKSLQTATACLLKFFRSLP